MTQPEHPLDHLSTEDLLEIAAGVVEDVQVRDLGLLASAVARPRTTVFGRQAYPALADEAAALMHSLARTTRSSTVTSAWPGQRPASSACSTAPTWSWTSTKPSRWCWPQLP
ncbi:hypothetical protein AB2L27_00025 [Kineococcus sp. LSe6-4]|uniref:Uncharacterized protein n=1 Tax=Kineococcus halophytocola TaxID=3234027 RepID=A0ABV4GY52_9ACTN